jgi:hypothetical protein
MRRRFKRTDVGCDANAESDRVSGAECYSDIARRGEIRRSGANPRVSGDSVGKDVI